MHLSELSKDEVLRVVRDELIRRKELPVPAGRMWGEWSDSELAAGERSVDQLPNGRWLRVGLRVRWKDAGYPELGTVVSWAVTAPAGGGRPATRVFVRLDNRAGVTGYVGTWIPARCLA